MASRVGLLLAVLLVAGCAASQAGAVDGGTATRRATSSPTERDADATQREAGAPPSSATVDGPAGFEHSIGASSAPSVEVQAMQSKVAAAKRWWRPTVGLTWQWQLSGHLDQTVDVDVYDVDMFDTSAATVRALHAAGRRVICYIDVGSREDYRPDADDFPASVIGASNGWPGERWLDIRQRKLLRPIMKARIAQCARKGFDGVEPDLLDAFSNHTGFPITAADQLRYNRMIARLAHAHGLAVGLKGDPEQAAQLVKKFDFAINEQCVEYHECGLLRPFIAAGKPVFHVEYTLKRGEFCPVTTRLHFSSMRKHLALGAWRRPCRPS